MTRNVKGIILDLFKDRSTIRSRDVTALLGLTRQAVHGHLRRLVDAGELELIGAGRGARYRRAASVGSQRFVYETSGLEEDRVWEEVSAASEAIDGLGEVARAILQYALTELVNNAIDHSGAEEVLISVDGGAEAVSVDVVDAGIGLFEHYRRCFDLETELEAFQEIIKGKSTTMPSRHSGEGLFFVSKAVDQFEVTSGGLRWLVDNLRDDVLVEDLEVPRRGTWVTVRIAPNCERDLGAVFEEYTDDYEFVRTRMVVKLFSIGVRFVSRSEARRLVHGHERFREVILDFEGVRGVGQGFADEVFRVWRHLHPEVALRPINMTRAVEFMVKRAQRQAVGATEL